MPEHLFGRLARSGFVGSQCRQASIAAVHSIMNDGNIGSCPERAWASITLRKYLNERTFAGLSSPDWGRPRPKWPGSRPIARQAGRATEPRLVGSRRSRPIRVAVARPAPTIAQRLTIQGESKGHDDRARRAARSPHLQFLCSAAALFLRTGLRPVNAVTRSGKCLWAGGLFLTGASTMALLNEPDGVKNSHRYCNDIGVRSFILSGAPNVTNAGIDFPRVSGRICYP